METPHTFGFSLGVNGGLDRVLANQSRNSMVDSLLVSEAEDESTMV